MKERLPFPGVFRRRVARVQQYLATARRQYPRTKEALRLLQVAVDEEVPRPAVQPGKKRKATPGAAATGAAATGAHEAAAPTESRKWYFQARRLRLERDALAAKLRRFSGAKEEGHYMLSEEWLMRVFLSKPNASARSLEQSFGDIVGSDVRTVSRPAMNAIRDAWVEMYKPLVHKAGAALVATTARLAKQGKAAFAPVFLVQIQDEADIRLRSESSRDGPAVPSRSRASKVQQSVLTIHGAGEQVVRWPCELEALGNKSAATLATSHERLLRSVVAGVLPQPQAEGLPRPQAAAPDVWIWHVVIGDGIGTNEAAGKTLWACVRQRPLAPGTRYFLVVLKCVTHQTGLTARSSVEGRAAAMGAGGSELYKALTGVAARLFKFVICDYFEEFVFSVREWVVAALVVQPAEAGEDAAATGAAAALQLLYTEHVVPKGMLALWNNGLGSLRHRLAPGQDPVAERPRLVNDFVQWIVKHLLHVDSHPTLSRFFTFRGCIDRMMTMSLIGMPRHAFKVRSIKPRAESQKRLRAVHGFFQHPDAPQTLRRACLAFQLTGGVEALVSANPSTGEAPPLVRLVREEAADCLELRLQDIFVRLVRCDPSLDVAPAVSVLLTTAMDMFLRVRAFLDYPIALVRMSKRWFPYSYLGAIHDFLSKRVEQLDVGAGAQLHELAWNQGHEMAACAWLVTKPVQELLDQFCHVSLASSLPVERSHSEVKKWEASKLTHIAVASRNAICMRFLKWRQEQCEAVACKQQALRRAVRTNLQSLAWQASPANRPAGVRRRGSGVCQPPAAEDDGDGASQPQAVAGEAAGLAMSAHVALHRDALAAKKRGLLAVADRELKELLASFSVPVTRPQWAEWLSHNSAEFRERMRTASSSRREGNKRLFARPDLPAPARRITRQVAKRSCNAEWAKRLANRSGWWGLETRDNGVVILFLMVLRGRTYYMDMDNRAATGVPTCTLDTSFMLRHSMNELPDLEAALVDDEVSNVWEFKALAWPVNAITN